MAHHQKHGVEHDAQVSRTLQAARPSAAGMPAISEDELAAEVDEPPDSQRDIPAKRQTFSKTALPFTLSRRESLLTQALHTDSESCADDDAPLLQNALKQAASISSTCSTHSARSVWDFMSDDGGHGSVGTRASTPSSPRSSIPGFDKLHLTSTNSSFTPRPLQRISSQPVTSTFKTTVATSPVKDVKIPEENNVEAKLGRKRCITFACSNKATAPATTTTPAKEPAKVEAPEKTQAPAKRPCSIMFACPFSKDADKAPSSPKAKGKFGRHLSPAPPVKKTTATTPASLQRRHRDSDTTIRNASPRPGLTDTVSTPAVPRLPTVIYAEPASLPKCEKLKCHIFASSDEEVEDWTQEATVHRSRITVDDTLEKENTIRRLGEEAEEEEALEADDEDAADLDVDDDDDDDDEDVEDDLDDDEAASDDGFQTDDEEGFAESDDDANDSDSDYEWWTPRRTKASSPFTHPFHSARRVPQRSNTDSSLESINTPSPKSQAPLSMLVQPPSSISKPRKKARAVEIRPDPVDLPDSTDFVCGTLDEDRPLEEAYIANLKQRQAAKHKAVPQDIDPSFPTSDPEMDMDEEDDDDADDIICARPDEGDHRPFFGVHGHDELVEEEFRGRKPSVESPTASSPKRRRSPAPAVLQLPLNSGKATGARVSGALAKSPAPPRIVMSQSPVKMSSTVTGRTTPAKATASTLKASGPSAVRMKSPHPSARAATPDHPDQSTQTLTVKHHPFLVGGNHRKITHTSSLPRSPAPIGRKLLEDSNGNTGASTPCYDDQEEDSEFEENPESRFYARRAIDIKQGLEHKRLRRRQKLYSLYALKAEKKKRSKRPAPGKGADRMRQVGIECAKYRGKRIISL